MFIISTRIIKIIVCSSIVATRRYFLNNGIPEADNLRGLCCAWDRSGNRCSGGDKSTLHNVVFHHSTDGNEVFVMYLIGLRSRDVTVGLFAGWSMSHRNSTQFARKNSHKVKDIFVFFSFGEFFLVEKNNVGCKPNLFCSRWCNGPIPPKCCSPKIKNNNSDANFPTKHKRNLHFSTFKRNFLNDSRAKM